VEASLGLGKIAEDINYTFTGTRVTRCIFSAPAQETQ